MSKEVSILVEYPSPETVIMQYTGLSEVTGMEPPVYACVGTNDGIASYRSMEQRGRPRGCRHWLGRRHHRLETAGGEPHRSRAYAGHARRYRAHA